MARRTNAAVKVSEAEVVESAVVVAVASMYPTQAELIENGFTTTSARIRELARLGAKNGEIAKILTNEKGNIRYQHVRNVLAAPLKKPVKDTEASASA